MKRKINYRLIQIAAMAIITTLLLTAASCYKIFKDQIMEDLKEYAEIVRYAVLREQYDFWGQDFKTLAAGTVRITLIDTDGSVLGDTQANTSVMENHGDRPEVRDAASSGTGRSVRQSSTLGANTYYYAVRLENGQILRVSKNADSIYMIMGRTLPYLAGLSGLLFVICCIFSYFLSESLIRPVRLIAENIDNIGKTQAYEELEPYIDAIKSKQNDVLLNAKMRQEFTANVSHELKTPLTAISGYSELIENGMASSQDEVKRFAREIRSNANRLLVLINDVIRLSELDDDETKDVLEMVDLGDAAQTCVDMLQISADKHKVQLCFEGESAVIMSNRHMIDEVLYNLCDNAIRYNKEGGRVCVGVKKKTDAVILTVADTGIGIPKEHQERIFERFYRVDKGRSKSTGGTGLGLAIVKHILIRLGAEISLESKEGEGTLITVVFNTFSENKE
ncbi:MAG: ATP-binding protein [Bacillota bacterium]|nr:ATP-binding protein [Bacillota bacterium]